ncbi:MAG: hypothetical protein BWY13_00491 [Euryarchaeota archaeon ADurb.Bin190]|uniref:Sjogren's syndrome/scleroderma autoantigen 1 family protein n=1 Tax=Methanothrix soehngenii TaxID=2223 RepID=UPI0009CF5E9D|nr:Sjogren's syndrome/scleroderma autoantigen 1 family protein [Methanothrix soehngenii]OQB26013.1 MAG: hypothetical protein BWY13_00491 [Euryarchaeota archaeon ADurb.Bin190]HNQ53666.1 Sjogren's syndrome/scleroderma autoantigen 1 family protein [Methanothrix soehngenii]
MQEDEVLAKITKLLERGCTMLASHHDCGAPLFRCQGDIVCPVCSFEDESVSAMRRPASEAVSGEEERRQDLSRAQLMQIHETPSRRGIKKDRSDRSAEKVEPDQSAEIGQSDRSREGYPSIQDEVQFHSVENDLRSALLFRLHELTASLRAEQDLDKLKRLLDCLEALLRVLKSLSE